MAVGLDEIMASFHFSQRFFRAHLNGIRSDQWDWKPFPACRSIREILLHWADLYSPGQTGLQTALEPTEPNVATVQSLMKEAGERYAAEYHEKYADTPMDAPFRPNGITVGTVLASFPAEDNYHAGQIAFIRLATEPEWDWVKAVHQTPEQV